jgi:tRNA(Ile)-lysidine synthase
VADRVELAFREAAERLIRPGTRLLVAVSGGADSVALLHLLHRWSRGRGLHLVVAHLDHALRRSSRADRRFVEDLARELGWPAIAERRDVAAARRRGESPEEAARRVRRTFLLEAAAREACAQIAVGHTLDDQAETVLLRLVRGAATTALAGMTPAGPGPFVRPLLDIERAELRGLLARRDLPFREDPSNRDLRFDRNRVRRLVLPLLEAQLNPRAARHLVQAAARLREDAQHLDALARAAYRRLLRAAPAGRTALDARRLSRLAPPLAGRVARLAVHDAGVDGRRVAARHVAAVLDLARGPDGRRASLPGSCEARRTGGLVTLTRTKRGG